MALSADEKKLLAELQDKESQPEHDDEDWEFDIYDTNAGKGARIPYKKGKSWLFDTFGIGEAPAPAKAEPEEDGGAGGDAPPAGPARGGSYFGKPKQ